MRLQDAVALARRWIEAEHAWSRTRLEEAGEASEAEAWAALTTLATPEVARWLERVAGAEASPWRSTREDLVPRTLFQVVAHDHPEHGRLHRAYLSEDRSHARGTEKYQLALLIGPDGSEAGEALRVVGLYWVCTACVALGEDPVVGDRCLECEGLGWEPVAGLALDRFGPVVEAARLEMPSVSLYHPEWKRGKRWPRADVGEG